LFEETGLSVVERYTEKVFDEFYICTREHQKIDKHVGYFLGRVATKKIALQNKELDAFARVSFQYAQEKLSFPEIKEVVAKAQKILLTK
jgi:8-oxo-dGTP pyrophosphatase MutT (NUDIX family)